MKYIKDIYTRKDEGFRLILIEFKDKEKSLVFYNYKRTTEFIYIHIPPDHFNNLEKLELYEIVFNKELLKLIINSCKKKLKLTQDIEIKEIFLKIEKDLKKFIH